ncbi:MAG: thioredoxin [Planctomycetota bacterium]
MPETLVKHLTESDFEQAVSEGWAVVDFWAPWCGPCKMMAPVLDGLAERHPEVTVAKVNVDENAALAARFGVSAIPLLVVLKDGQEVDRLVGVHSAGDLAAVLRRHTT